MKAIITIEDIVLRKRVQELLDTNNYVISLTAPTISSPFPLWIYKGTIKLWTGNRWKNVGECPTFTDSLKVTENGILKRTE